MGWMLFYKDEKEKEEKSMEAPLGDRFDDLCGVFSTHSTPS